MQLLKRKIRGGQIEAAAAGAPNKVARLKRKLAREAVMCGIIVTVAGIALYFVTDWATAKTSNRDTLSASVTQLTGAISQFETQLTKAEKSLPVFERVFKDPDKLEIALDRRSVTELLEKLREEYLLASLRLGMSPVKTLDDAAYKTNFAVAQAVEMELDIEAISDEHVINFLDQLRRELPGKLKVLRLDLNRESDIAPQTFQLVAQSGKVALVKATIKLLWMGISQPAAPAITPPQGQ